MMRIQGNWSFRVFVTIAPCGGAALLSVFLDVSLASLLYLNQRNAHLERQREHLAASVHYHAYFRHANEHFHYVRGKRSLTNQKVGVHHTGHHPQARLVVFLVSSPH